jgi:hypothetical protein
MGKPWKRWRMKKLREKTAEPLVVEALTPLEPVVEEKPKIEAPKKKPTKPKLTKKTTKSPTKPAPRKKATRKTKVAE